MGNIIFGIIALGLGIWGIITYWFLFKEVMQGLMPFVLLITGVVLIITSTRKKTEDIE